MTWINLKDIMLSERNQSQKTIFYMIQFIGNIQNRQTYKGKPIKDINGCLGLVGEGRGDVE